MPNGFNGQVTNVTNNVVANPLVDTAYLGLTDYFNGDTPLVVRQTIQEVSEYYNMRDVLAMLELSDRVSATDDLEVRSYEQGPMFRPVKIQAIVGTGSAGEAVVTLTADSFTGVGTIEGSGTIARTSLMKNDLIRFRNGSTGIVRLKSSDPGVGGAVGTSTQFTLRGLTGSAENLLTAINDHITNSVPLFVFSNAYPEAAFIPTEGLESSTTSWRNQAQTIQTFRASTGDANAVKIVDWTGKDRFFYKQEIEMGGEHRIKEKFALWFGPGGFTEVDGKRVRLCLGVDTAINKMGNTYTYAQNTFSIADMDAIVDQIEAINGGSIYDFQAGHKLFGEVQKVFSQLLNATGQTGIDYSNFGKGDAKQKMIDLGIMAIIYRGITFRLMQTDVLSLPELTGIGGYVYPSDGYLLPSKKQTVEVEENGRRNKLTVSSLEVKYTKELNGSMRRYQFTPYRKDVLQQDITKANLFTQVVPQIVNTRKMIKIKCLVA